MQLNKLKNVHGFWLPEREEHLLRFADGPGWSYQKHKLDAAMRYVKHYGVAIDIGAHCGLWSVHLTKLFNYVYAFEPIELHRKAYALNVLNSNVELLPFALGEKDKNVKLRYRPSSSGDTKVATAKDEGFIQFDAEMRMLDSFGTKPDFIKIDTEGYELFILHGGEKTITKHRPVIIVEQKPNKAVDYGIGDVEAVIWLKNIGYQLKEVISGDYIMVPE